MGNEQTENSAAGGLSDLTSVLERLDARAAKRRRTANKAALMIVLAAAAILWARSIIADVQGWQAKQTGAVEMRLRAAGE